MARLHINVDHVATVRQARREAFPDPLLWALEAEKAGADGITCHLRKDRRHVQDADVARFSKSLSTLFNLESSLDSEMIDIALLTRPDEVCLVPENRAEVTTEGGLDVVAERKRLEPVVARFRERGVMVSLFVDADERQLEVAAELGADFVELHTGAYANAPLGAKRDECLERLFGGARYAHEAGLRVNAGHGLDYDNIEPMLALPFVEEFNIGFAIVAHSLFVGVHEAVSRMKDLVSR